MDKNAEFIFIVGQISAALDYGFNDIAKQDYDYLCKYYDIIDEQRFANKLLMKIEKRLEELKQIDD